MEKWGQSAREKEKLKEWCSRSERELKDSKGLNSGGNMSKPERRFWEILKIKVEWRGDWEWKKREKSDTFRSQWCNGHSAAQVTETTGKSRSGYTVVVDTG